MQNNINANNNVKTNTKNNTTQRPVRRYGMPACGGGKLLPGNTYVSESKRPAVKGVNKEEKKQTAEVLKEETVVLKEQNSCCGQNVENRVPAEMNSDSCVISEEKNKIDVFKPLKAVARFFKKAGKGLVSTVTNVESPVVRSVRADEKSGKVPVSRIILVGLLVVLLMFVIIDYVKIFENNQMISELKNELDSYSEQEKKLTAELAEQYDIVEIGEYASDELGMVSGENQKKVYVDVSEDDTIEGYDVPTEDYGAIATIMNALGQSAQAWLEIFEG